MKTKILSFLFLMAIISCQSSKVKSSRTDQEIVLDVVNPPLNYETTAKLSGDIFQPHDNNGEVYWAHIKLSYHPTDSVLQKEIRWWIYDVWNSHQTCDGIIISCLDSATLDQIATAHFAPNGKMVDVKDGTPYDEFNINIQTYE